MLIMREDRSCKDRMNDDCSETQNSKAKLSDCHIVMLLDSDSMAATVVAHPCRLVCRSYPKTVAHQHNPSAMCIQIG